MSILVSAALAGMEGLPLLAFDQLHVRGLVVVAPHPDDESLGCGGLIACANAHGVPVRILVVSDGTGSHPNSPSYPPERLRHLRETETLKAAGELGVAEEQVIFLRLPDRFVPATGPDAEKAVAGMIGQASACDANMMAVTWQHDPHCDHRAAFLLALEACRRLPRLSLFAYPIWGLTLPPDQLLDVCSPQGFRLAIDEHLPAKRRAIAAHRSQVSRLIDDDPDGFVLGSELAYFDRPYEIYLAA
jgi:LmbE family N-acetylglucosaminyl deacetylase